MFTFNENINDCYPEQTVRESLPLILLYEFLFLCVEIHTAENKARIIRVVLCV